MAFRSKPSIPTRILNGTFVAAVLSPPFQATGTRSPDRTSSAAAAAGREVTDPKGSFPAGFRGG